MATTPRRKLLTAAVGVATVSYVVACGGLGGKEQWVTSGNLVAPIGAGGAASSGDLAAPPPTGIDYEAANGGYGGGITSGNLVAALPPPAIGGSGAVPDDASPAGSVDSGASADPLDAGIDSGP
jgi:hypothetical protein